MKYAKYDLEEWILDKHYNQIFTNLILLQLLTFMHNDE